MTAVPLASAFVRVGVNDSRLQSGLARVKTLATAAVGFIAAQFATLKAISVFSGLIDELDKLNDLSNRLNLPVETLSRLGYIAGQSGVDMDTLARAMAFAERTMYDAANGSEAAQAAFAALGLDAKKFIETGTRIANVVPLLAERFMALGDAQRQAVAQDIFGRGGVEVLQLMAEGADSLRESLAEAADIGLPTTDQAKAADEFNDAADRLWQTLKGIGYTIVADLAPALTDLVNRFQDAMKSGSSFADTMKNLGKVLAAVVSIGGGIVDFIDDLDMKLLEAGFGADWGQSAGQGWADVQDGIKKIRDQREKARGGSATAAANEASRIRAEQASLAAKLAAEASDLPAPPVPKVDKKTEALRQQVNDLKQQVRDLKGENRDLQRDNAEAIRAAAREARDSALASMKAPEILSTFTSTFSGLDSAWGQIQDAINSTNRDQLAAAKANTEATKENTKALGEVASAVKKGGMGLSIVS